MDYGKKVFGWSFGVVWMEDRNTEKRLFGENEDWRSSVVRIVVYIGCCSQHRKQKRPQ